MLGISFLGDIAFTGLLSHEPEKNTQRFKQVAPILTVSTFVFANLEVPLKVDDSKNEYKNFTHYSLPDPTKQLLKLLNIGCVSLANNHIYDCKMTGLKATINLLDELGIFHTGAGWLEEHIEPVIISNNGYKIGFIAYVDKSTNPKTEKYPELLINYFDVEKILKDVESLKPKVDQIICSIHWGVDYSFYPTKNQISDARKIINAGVDIVMGHHPHTLQPYEKYNQGHIFYSLGGITFGDFRKYKDGPIQALYKKTKVGLIVNYDLQSKDFAFVSTKEKKGNYVKLNNVDYARWSKRKWKEFRIKQKNKLMVRLFNFKESVIDRIFEYFFGYYKNPLKRLLQFSNLKKIRRLINNSTD